MRNSSCLAEKVGGAVSQCVRGCAIFEVDLDFAIIDFAGFGLVFEADNGFEDKGETAQMCEGLISIKSDF